MDLNSYGYLYVIRLSFSLDRRVRVRGEQPFKPSVPNRTASNRAVYLSTVLLATGTESAREPERQCGAAARRRPIRRGRAPVCGEVRGPRVECSADTAAFRSPSLPLSVSLAASA